MPLTDFKPMILEYLNNMAYSETFLSLNSDQKPNQITRKNTLDE